MNFEIRQGDVLARLAEMPEASVNCVVTSPPYFNLRDYGNARQIGLEKTPEEYVGRLVAVFREVRRVLADDGTLWLNIGDCYASGEIGRHEARENPAGIATTKKFIGTPRQYSRSESGLKPKDLVGIPWRVAFALQNDGWWLRSEIIWAKPNPMPESVRDRPTKSHEQIFLLTKSARYFYDTAAVAEPIATTPKQLARARRLERGGNPYSRASGRKDTASSGGLFRLDGMTTRNKRSVWAITPKPFKGAHFATFPPEIPETCIRAGCPPDGVVLDPFAGACTTLLAALQLGRRAIGIELNPAYCSMAAKRITNAIREARAT